ncbi:MAG TPA: NAD(P)H-dependent glycerol-3-phosphate dehydrogenase [Armatimonadota bacterium]|jgi:glycerol-3-phosphate dehydrogenase (NAD(P)+)
MNDEFNKVAVLGAGAWGTTLAAMLARSGRAVRLWCLEADLAEDMRTTRRNRRYRPECELPPSLTVHTDLAETLETPDAVVLAVPSQFLRGVLEQARAGLLAAPLLLNATKGLEEATGLRMSQVIGEVLGSELPLATLSGPNLSKEIASGKPAMSVVAAATEQIATRAQRLMSSPLFRVYRNCDIIGVEICGALKNVIAIGAGASDGLDLGANAKAALVTRGLTEMGRLGVCLGAQPATFWGAAGMGDLVATCHSSDSRNWSVGNRLARGESWDEIRQATYSVAEGVYTAVAARRLGREFDVAVPLTEAICSVLFEKVAVSEAVTALMTRPEKAENEAWCSPQSPGQAG